VYAFLQRRERALNRISTQISRRKEKMGKKESEAVSAIMLTLLLMGMLTLAFNVQPVGSFVPPPKPQWTQTYGGWSTDEAWSVVQTSDGGYALAGYTSTYGAGSSDFWLIKTDSSGNPQWNKTYGGTNWEVCYCAVQTSDGGYALAGYTTSFGAGSYDFWLIKTDSSGNMEWNKTYGGNIWDSCYCVIQTSDGGYALAGWTDSYGAGGWDFWLIKTDSSGNMEWNKTYGGTNNDIAYSVVQTSDGGYALAGGTRSYGAGSIDFWLIKTDSAGNPQWNQTYGGTYGELCRCVVQTNDGGYALAGGGDPFGAGHYDFWVVKTGSTGNMLWNRTYGGANYDVGWSMVERNDGGYAIVGYTASYGAGNNDFWLIRTDSNGNMEWNQTFGGTADDRCYSMAQTLDGGYALAGLTGSFGAGFTDFWLIKLGPFGPTASFTHSPEKPQVNDLAAFNASLSTPGWNDGNEPPIVTYAWDFESDGVIDAYGVTVTHAFPAVGTYTVTLNVTDAQGLWDTETHTIKVISVATVIRDGVSWLVNQQNPDGSWGSWYRVAQTGLAVLKLEEHAVDPKYGYGLPSPFDPRYPYREHVEKGLNYIFAHAYIMDISMQPAGHPDTNGNGKGVCFLSWDWDYQRTYQTAIAMMAIAGSRAPDRVVSVTGSPVDGWTYRDVLQDAVDYLAFGQNDADWARGGWSYYENDVWRGSDQSCTGWATFGLGFAESPTYKFACTIPAFVKTELNIWIDYVQNDVDGDPNHGGAGYQGPYGANILRTGHLLYMMALVGDTPTTTRVQDAVAYLVRHWNDPNVDPGWKGATGETASYQATLNVMKGLFTLGIHEIDGIDWQTEFEHVLKAQQLDDGSWPSSIWDESWDRILSTEWALLTLEKVAPPPISKELSPTQGELGDVVHVTLNVRVAAGETATVVDTLPPEWKYLTGTFRVNGVSATPTLTSDEQVSYTITASGAHVIEFDVRVTMAYWEDRTVTNKATATWYDELGNIVEQMEATADFVIYAFQQLHKTTTGSLTIKEKTNVQWPVTLEVTNPFSYTMTNVVITDRFGAQIEIDKKFPYRITQGKATYTLYGTSEQVHLTWNIGNLGPGETARLIVLVSTDINPAGKQEYTMPGVYELNSGVTLKFIDPQQNIQLSAVTDSVYVTVLPA